MREEDEEVDLRSRGDRSRARKAGEEQLAKLAKTLMALSTKQLAKLDLVEDVADALAEARRIKSHGARARQLRVVRRELRDADSAAIAEAVEVLLDPRRQPPPKDDPAARWVGAFVEEGNDAVERFLREHAHAERQHLQRLTRNARQPNAAKAKKARKALLSTVRAQLAEGDDGEEADSAGSD